MPFAILPSRFLLLGLLLYMGLEMVAALILEDYPSMPQQSLVSIMRLIQLCGFVALIYHYSLWASLGLNKPTADSLHIFLQISAACIACVAMLYWIQPSWFAYIQSPAWINGFTGVVLMVLLAPIVEELIFRGLLYRMLREQWNIAISVSVSAVFFSLVHHGQIISPQLAGGIIFALAYEWSRSLWVAIGLHIGANSAVYLLSVLG